MTSDQNSFNAGDLVYCLDKTRKKGLSPKLNSDKWQGPFVVVRKITELLFEIKQNKSQSKVVHHDRLKPYLSNDLPDWVPRLQEQAMSGKISTSKSRAVQTMFKLFKNLFTNNEYVLCCESLNFWCMLYAIPWIYCQLFSVVLLYAICVSCYIQISETRQQQFSNIDVLGFAYQCWYTDCTNWAAKLCFPTSRCVSRYLQLDQISME